MKEVVKERPRFTGASRHAAPAPVLPAPPLAPSKKKTPAPAALPLPSVLELPRRAHGVRGVKSGKFRMGTGVALGDGVCE